MNVAKIEEGLRALLAPGAADGEPCARDFYRYAAGDMTPGESATFENHLQECSDCREDLAALRRLPAEATPKSRFFVVSPAWLAATGFFFLCILSALLWLALRGPEAEAIFRIKGAAAIKVAVQRGEQRFVAASGDLFKTGDVLGFFYTSPVDCYLTLLFSDEQGRISRISPAQESLHLPAGAEQPLPDGAVLEPGEGCEWIAAFFSKEPQQLEVVEDLLRRAVRSRGPQCQLGEMKLEDTSAQVMILRRAD